jgi:hypothetical protein
MMVMNRDISSEGTVVVSFNVHPLGETISIAEGGEGFAVDTSSPAMWPWLRKATGGTPCSDSFYCNGAETCQSGSCTAGTAPSCARGCNEATDACNECLLPVTSQMVDTAAPSTQQAASHRDHREPEQSSNAWGFRCARTVVEASR